MAAQERQFSVGSFMLKLSKFHSMVAHVGGMRPTMEVVLFSGGIGGDSVISILSFSTSCPGA